MFHNDDLINLTFLNIDHLTAQWWARLTAYIKVLLSIYGIHRGRALK